MRHPPSLGFPFPPPSPPLPAGKNPLGAARSRREGVRCISLWPKPENREATPHVAATVSKAARRNNRTWCVCVCVFMCFLCLFGGKSDLGVLVYLFYLCVFFAENQTWGCLSSFVFFVFWRKIRPGGVLVYSLSLFFGGKSEVFNCSFSSINRGWCGLLQILLFPNEGKPHFVCWLEFFASRANTKVA